MRFIAIASVSCASREIEPSDMAPVENRFTISLAGSTSSSGIPPSGVLAEPQQAAERVPPHGVLVHGLRVRLVRLPLLVADGVLEQRDRVGVPLVVLAVAPPGVEPDHRQQRVAVAGVGPRVAREHVAREALGADAADARRGAGEVALDELRREADGLEDLGAAVRRDRRDPHLRQRLEEPLAEPLDRPRLRLVGRHVLRQPAELDELGQRLEHQVRVDGRGAVADQRRDAVDAARLARLDDEAGLQARALAHEVMVHRCRREERRHGSPLGADGAVGEDQDVGAGRERLVGLAAEAVERDVHPGRALRRRATSCRACAP